MLCAESKAELAASVHLKYLTLGTYRKKTEHTSRICKTVYVEHFERENELQAGKKPTQE